MFHHHLPFPPLVRHRRSSDITAQGRVEKFNAHSGKLRGSTSRDLLDTKLTQLGLQLVELLREVILALSPELAGLDFGARLLVAANEFSISNSFYLFKFKNVAILNIPFWAASSRCRKVVELKD